MMSIVLKGKSIDMHYISHPDHHTENELHFYPPQIQITELIILNIFPSRTGGDIRLILLLRLVPSDLVLRETPRLLLHQTSQLLDHLLLLLHLQDRCFKIENKKATSPPNQRKNITHLFPKSCIPTGFMSSFDVLKI